MRRLLAAALLVPLLVVAVWAPAADAGDAANVALGLASFIVFTSIVGALTAPAYAYREVVYATPQPVVYQQPVVYRQPAVVYAPPPQPTTVVYPHGRYELRYDGAQYAWIWIPAPPPAQTPIQ